MAWRRTFWYPGILATSSSMLGSSMISISSSRRDSARLSAWSSVGAVDARKEASKSSSSAATGGNKRSRRGSARCADGLSATDGLSSSPDDAWIAHRRTRHTSRACRMLDMHSERGMLDSPTLERERRERA